ncbi:uncharacterized protein LOC112682908 isoform X2 [Sipha flava]|nr:uncharacterized protein LOC112682908 isoform X2 [Sipha flava]
MKRLGHLLLVFICLTYLIIMINGYSLRRFRPLYIPDDNYNIDFDESSLADNKLLLNAGRKFPDDSIANDAVRSSDSNINNKKRNSEIISALMGLRRAVSNNYGEHHVHD